MIFLNFIYFLAITICGYRFLKSDGGLVKGALDREKILHYSGPELFWCLTFSTGLLALSGNVGIDLMAVRLLMLEILCVIGLSTVADRPVWTPALRIYLIYLLWLFIGCFYGPSWAYGIRVILKYTYPLLLCLFASAAVRDAEVFLKSSRLARMVALISVIFAFVPFIGLLIPGVFWYATARAINYISIMIFSLGLFYFTSGPERRRNLFYAILFILPCFMWVFRTSIMGSLVAIMTFYFIKYRLRSLPIIAAIILAGVIAVFTIPSLKKKMFKTGTKNATIENFQEGGIGMDQVETNAREGMWTFLENRFYKEHELIGSGTASVQNYMYTHRVFGGLRVPHSDFVQMKCDNGLIGIFIYACIPLLIFFHAFRTYWGTDIPIIRLSALVAGASMIGVFVTCYSDNVVNYSMCTLSMPYGFYGMMLGLKTHYES